MPDESKCNKNLLFYHFLNSRRDMLILLISRLAMPGIFPDYHKGIHAKNINILLPERA